MQFNPAALSSSISTQPQLSQASGGMLRNGTWTGVMGELVSGRANASAFPLTLTADRANAISYTTAYLDEGYAMLVKQHKQTLPADAFLLPFHVSARAVDGVAIANGLHVHAYAA